MENLARIMCAIAPLLIFIGPIFGKQYFWWSDYLCLVAFCVFVLGFVNYIKVKELKEPGWYYCNMMDDIFKNLWFW